MSNLLNQEKVLELAKRQHEKRMSYGSQKLEPKADPDESPLLAKNKQPVAMDSRRQDNNFKIQSLTQ